MIHDFVNEDRKTICFFKHNKYEYMNNNFTLDQFVLSLPGYHLLTEKQMENTSRLIGISKKFCEKGKINVTDREVESNRSIILESGHQPNFFPYPGIWKKVFCLNRIQNELTRQGHPSIAFFGFADQNISTARILSKNQIPVLNKEGLLKIGFKIHDADKFKSFNLIGKPSPELWQNEIKKIEKHYSDTFKKARMDGIPGKKQLDQVLEILWKSYELAENFAELNAFIIAKISNELLDVKVCFFIYSDMHHERFFLEESTRILQNLPQFNKSYNFVIEQKKLDIPLVKTDRLPFWYECDCGVKIDIFLNDSSASALKCPVCYKEYYLDFGENFENLSRYYDKMDFNAVSRNIAMAHGLGDSLFLSGAGGSLQYGQISDQISDELGFHRPMIFAWRSRDYYLGMAHSSAVHEIMKQFSLTSEDILTSALNPKIRDTFVRIAEKIHESKSSDNQKELKYWSGVNNNAKSQIFLVKNVLSTIPSFIDLLVNLKPEKITYAWNLALEHAEIQKLNDVYQIRYDIDYHTDLLSDIPSDVLSVFYENIKRIEVE
jgi:hypothetical protein